VSSIVIGIDGGGSKTRVIVADEQGQTVSAIEGAGSAVRPGGVEYSADTIVALVRDALESAGMPHVVPKVLCAGIAGVGRDADRQALWQTLTSREIAEEVVVHADAAIALDDAFGEDAGILLVAGTGSIAYARSPAGVFGRCGGWGPVFGDEGSGAWIGRRALSVVTAAADGREPETALTGAVLTAAQVDDTRDLVDWAARATPAAFASLAPAVIATAHAGDLRANAVLALAVEELTLHVRALARRLFVDERAAVQVALAGGLLAPRSPLRRQLEQRLKSAVPGAEVLAREIDPARGAVRGALRYLGTTAA
jgi:glucosamine kinase